MPSAAFHIASQASGLKYAGSAAGTAVATLDSLDGVEMTTWSIDGYDETSAGAWSLSGATLSQVTINFPASGTGKAALVKCIVNNDPTTAFRVKVYIAPEIGAVGETTESDSNYGQAAWMNPSFRGVAAAAAATAAATPDTVCKRDASGGTAFDDLTCTSLAVTSAATIDQLVNLSRFIGLGSSGTAVSAGTGNLSLRAASGGKVVIGETGAGTDSLEIWDNAGATTIGTPSAYFLWTTNYAFFDCGVSFTPRTPVFSVQTLGGVENFQVDTTTATGFTVAKPGANGYFGVEHRAAAGLHAHRSFHNTVQTTNNSATTAFTSPSLANGTVVLYRLSVVAYRSSGNTFAATTSGAFNTEAGAPTVLVGADADYLGHSLGTGSTLSVALDTSGATFRVRVTGNTAETWRWEVYVDIYYGSA